MEQNAMSQAAAVVYLLALFSVVILCFVSMWKVFVKAGRPGWACLIPLVNAYNVFRISGRAQWLAVVFTLGLLIPGINVIILAIGVGGLAQAFGRGVFFAMGLLFLPFIFLPILAFGDAKHLDAEAQPQAAF